MFKEININKLKEHPRNYKKHPEDQIHHLIESIKRNGIYRPIIIAQDNTILAGHGIYQALKKLNYEIIPVFQLNIDSNSLQALKILIGDNEIINLVESDDRLLTEILKEIKNNDITGLIGTGYDEQMLANLVFITRPENEIKDFNEAAEWIGMPEFIPAIIPYQLIISFNNIEDKKSFGTEILKTQLTEKTKSIWWPLKQKEDLSSIKIVE